MATMNKPGLNDGNWYQPVTDNWTSIETNLLDKSAYTAKGDLLAGKGPSLFERIPVGTNGQVLTADAGQARGVKWENPLDMAESLFLKPFFRSQGFLPSNVIREDLYTWPAADFSNLNSGTLSRSMSRAKFTPFSHPANFGWSLGGTYSKVLVVLGGLRVGSYAGGILICDTLPAAPNPADGYLFQNWVGTSMNIWKSNGGGSYTQLGSETMLYGSGNTYAPSVGLAAYVDGTAHRLILWSRTGSEAWTPVVDISDSTLSTFKYAGINIWTFGSNHWFMCPLGIYAS